VPLTPVTDERLKNFLVTVPRALVTVALPSPVGLTYVPLAVSLYAKSPRPSEAVPTPCQIVPSKINSGSSLIKLTLL
jgi:hypothetical protein